ncbi:MAG TPA: DedA family protein [Acidiferrobacterales bacterium]|nr:DedA family protein [Acidiferrobacterales bacterium]
MTLELLIENYGYLAILILTFFEGETIVILAGVAAHLGLLELQWVMLSALAGSFGGDQLWFYIGRRWGPQVIARRPSWQEGAEKVYKHLHKHQYWLILTFRFYYGFRNVTPFVLGSSGIPWLRFFTLNLIGAIVWAFIFAYAGYLFGEAFKLFIDDYHKYALYVLGGLVAIGLAIWLTTLIHHRRKAREHGLK